MLILEKLYVAHNVEGLISIIKANSKEEAFDIFVTNKVKEDDDIIKEHVSEFITNSSLLENFFKDNIGSFFDSFTGDYPARLKGMNEKDLNEYVESWIIKNVREFWYDKPHFAEEYIRELNKSKYIDFYQGEFSDEFWVDVTKRLILQGDWYDDFNIVEINLQNDNYQVIRTH